MAEPVGKNEPLNVPFARLIFMLNLSLATAVILLSPPSVTVFVDAADNPNETCALSGASASASTRVPDFGAAYFAPIKLTCVVKPPG